MTAAGLTKSTSLPPAAGDQGLLRGWWLEAASVASVALLVVIGTTGLLIPGLVGWATLAFAAVLSQRGDGARRVVALAATATFVIAVPFTRVASSGLLIVVAAVTLLAVGLPAIAARRRTLPRGVFLVVSLVAVLLFSTAMSPDSSGLLRFLPFAAGVLPTFVVAGQSGQSERVRVLRVVLTLAVLQAVIALAELFLLAKPLWGPAQRNSAGDAVALLNPLLPSLERSQGTLGHPLPLGVLLAVGLAVLFRVFAGTSALIRWLLAAVLLAGLVASGSRNSLIIAVVVLVFFSAAKVGAVRLVSGVLVLLLGLGFAVATDTISTADRQEFTESGSYTHRLGAYDALGKLAEGQPVPNVIIGNGYASTSRIFESGLLQTDGFQAVDNQFILSFSQGGLVTLGLLVALLVIALVRVDSRLRAALLTMAATLAIFDVLNWPSATMLLMLLLAFAANPEGPPEDDTRVLRRADARE